MIVSGCATNKVEIEAEVADKSYQTFNYEIPAAMDNQIDSVLTQYKDVILTLEDVKLIDLSDLESGNIIEYRSTSIEKKVYTFTEKLNEFFYFDMVVTVDGVDFPAIYRTNGFVGQIAKIETPQKFYKEASDKCRYVIGECTYKIGSKQFKVNTSFNDGVWTTRRAMGVVGLGYITSKSIYDKNGLLLYQGTFSNQWADGKHSYTIRSN